MRIKNLELTLQPRLINPLHSQTNELLTALQYLACGRLLNAFLTNPSA